MRIVPIFCLAVALAAPAAMAADQAGAAVSIEEARDIARDYGVSDIEKVELDDGKWEVEGKDEDGEDFEVDIDAWTGDVIKVDHD